MSSSVSCRSPAAVGLRQMSALPTVAVVTALHGHRHAPGDPRAGSMAVGRIRRVPAGGRGGDVMRLRATAIACLLLVSAGLAAAPAAQAAQGVRGAKAARGSASAPSTATRKAVSWSVRWGRWDDWPVPGDYTGDARTDPAVIRFADDAIGTITWYVRGMRPVVWGRADLDF